jgi:hypothetical protein
VLTIGQWFYMFFSYLVYSSTCIRIFHHLLIVTRWPLLRRETIWGTFHYLEDQSSIKIMLKF